MLHHATMRTWPRDRDEMERAVLEAPGLVMVDFTANWCVILARDARVGFSPVAFLASADLQHRAARRGATRSRPRVSTTDACEPRDRRCMPCRVIRPELEALVASHPDVLFATVDLSQEGHELSSFVSAMPTFLFFKVLRPPPPRAPRALASGRRLRTRARARRGRARARARSPLIGARARAPAHAFCRAVTS